MATPQTHTHSCMLIEDIKTSTRDRLLWHCGELNSLLVLTHSSFVFPPRPPSLSFTLVSRDFHLLSYFLILFFKAQLYS